MHINAPRTRIYTPSVDMQIDESLTDWIVGPCGGVCAGLAVIHVAVIADALVRVSSDIGAYATATAWSCRAVIDVLACLTVSTETVRTCPTRVPSGWRGHVGACHIGEARRGRAAVHITAATAGACAIAFQARSARATVLARRFVIADSIGDAVVLVQVAGEDLFTRTGSKRVAVIAGALVRVSSGIGANAECGAGVVGAVIYI